VAHRNARLTVHGRRLIVTRVIDDGWTVAACAEAAGVSRATVYKWIRRFRDEGDPGLVDRTSRPMRSPRRLDERLEAKILLARQRRRWGPHQLSYYLGVPRSTAYKVLVRNGCSRLSDFDRPTHKPIRYVRDRPGELLHVDVKKLGRIPDGVAGGSTAAMASATGHTRAGWATTSCTSRSMITPGWRSSRSTPTRRAAPAPISSPTRSVGSPSRASRSSG